MKQHSREDLAPQLALAVPPQSVHEQRSSFQAETDGRHSSSFVSQMINYMNAQMSRKVDIKKHRNKL